MLPGGSALVPDGASAHNGAPQYLILNIGSGSVIGATMQVDYVRARTH